MSSDRPIPPVHPDVAAAETIDPRIAYDPGVHARVVDRVFARSWQLVHAPRDGAVVPFTLLEGCLDEPLVVTRDGDTERVLSNVCTHRGALLVESPGDGGAMVCPYHGRRFGLDGRMTRCPGFEDAKDFPRESDHLAELEPRAVGPLEFLTLGDPPQVPFDEWSAPLARALREYEGETLRFDPNGSALYSMDAGWAVYCENYLEGFHIPFVHPTLNRAIDFSKYRTEVLPYAVRQLGHAAGDEPRLVHGDDPDMVAEYLWLWPNLMVNVYPWGISVNVVEPTGPGRTSVRYLRWVAREDLVETGPGSGLDAVEREDQEVVLSVQKGVRARLYPGGRFSPRLETGPHHFHRLLADALGAD